jgi:hypothetical protein
MGWLDFLFDKQNDVRGRQQAFLANYEFPRGARDKFARRHPSLNARQIEQVFEALRFYFQLCHEANGKMVSMPSRVVDDAWHEFILFTRDYHEFCQGAFRRYLHHTPASASYGAAQEEAGKRLAYRLSCKREGLNPAALGAVPLLFALDSQLGITDGFVYTPEMLEDIQRKQQQEGGALHSGGGCGGATGGDSPDGCADGGSDGGACGDGGGSCGGGGCGGGGGGCGGG